MNKKDEIIILGMPNCLKLSKSIADKLKMPLSEVEKTVFADGEAMILSKETVRNKDVFIISSVSRPVNNNLMDLLLLIDSLKRGSAKSINVVITYYGYARQDRKTGGRQPIGAKLVADLLQVAGATKIIAVDLHNEAIQGFFNIPSDDLKGAYALAKNIKEYNDKFTIVSPDHGGAVRARMLAKLISDDIKICIIDKRRTGPNETEVLGLIGNIEDQNAVIIDDIIDTGGTIIKAAKSLKQHGAKKIVLAATHGIFSKGFEIFEECDEIDSVIITDSIDNYDLAKKFKKLKIVSLDNILSEVIKCQINGRSVSDLYEDIAKKL
ncbi:ribose-phosphate pyrophosphokinase [Mycoplasma sp. Mirounga ES2805-ORL]|uniref:ribose-phosphate pyrophosphokinase n=1 Tax=Mycoplasma sp. Mirounga ES2805-ORL TaxID=754514 RepID=UPI00197B40E9|nr:ribose-phosphate pyrophosphokinase [Mycoplasma sp. Mirounga ES2805-ORL]QSF13480.1 ribose-phosphate pyrophosphokinase [Mycoplasma sp. Mirounga ES2805-ORL]